MRRSGSVGSKWKPLSDGVVAGLRAFSAAILCRTSSSPGPCPECKLTDLGTTGGGRHSTRDFAGGIPPATGALSHEIVDCAFRNVKLQFVCKDVRDIPISQPAVAQPFYQFAVGFQTGAPRLFDHLVQNVLELVFHTPPKLRQHAPDRDRTNLGQRPDINRTERTPCAVPKPKPTGLGMVSSSKQRSRRRAKTVATLNCHFGAPLARIGFITHLRSLGRGFHE